MKRPPFIWWCPGLVWGMLFAPWLLAADSTNTHTANLSPAAPTDSWGVQLPAHDSATFTVNIAAEGTIGGGTTKYKLSGSPTQTITGSGNILWTGTVGQSGGTYTVTNTGTDTANTTVKVKCVWKASDGGGGGGGGSGGGGGAGQAVINGLATGIANLTGSHVRWTFSPTSTCANASGKIDWTATLVDDRGQPIDPSQTFSSISAVNLDPGAAVWTIHFNDETKKDVGTVSSMTSSTGHLKAQWPEDEDTATQVLTFFKLRLKEISFVGNGRNIMKRASDISHLLSEGEATIEGPEYVADDHTDPISYIKGSTPTVIYKLTVEPSVSSASVLVRLRSREFSSSNPEITSIFSLSFTGDEASQTVSTGVRLDSSIANTLFRTAWEYACGVDGPYEALDIVGLPLYVTYGAPGGSGVTDERLDWVTTKAHGKDEPHPATEALFNAIIFGFTATPLLEADLWKVATGSYQCFDGARFLRLAAKMLGLPEGTVKFIFPWPNKTSKLELSSVKSKFRSAVTGVNGHGTSNVPSGEHGGGDQQEEFLVYVDGSGRLNNFEATYELGYGGTTNYYSPGVGVDTSYQKILEGAADHTIWVWDASGVHPCVFPGPYPEKQWR